MSTNATFPSATALTASPVTSRMAEGSVLATLTSEQRKVNVVVVGVLGVIILVGLLGNALVLAVYRRRRGAASSTSPAILFILVMAGLDVVSCLLSVPYEILDLMKPYSNDNVPLCQACRFLTTVVSQSRGLMLLCVAWDRYLKICLPLTTYSYRHARVAVIAVVVLAVVLSWPQIPLNGHVTIHTHVPHVLATDCNIVRHLPAIYSLLYHGVLYLLFLVSFLMYGILYGRIFYVLWRNGWFESMSSAWGGKAQESGEPAGSQGMWKAVSRTQNRVRELEIRGLSSNEMDCVEESHSRVPCQKDCRGRLCCRHHGSFGNTSLNEGDACHKMLKGSKVLCPCVKIVQETEKCKFTHQTPAVSYKRVQEMGGSKTKLTDGFPKTPSGFGIDGSAFNSSCPTRNRTLPASAQNSSTAQNSTNQPLCEMLPGNYVGDFHCSKWYSSKRGYYKEKHPRAVLACQLQSEDFIHGHYSKCRGLHRSHSVPCCCLCEDTTSLPLLTHSDVHISLNSSPPAHRRAHFQTNIQEKFENFHSKLPVRLETAKQCSVSKSDHKAWSSSKKGQLFKNHSCTSFLNWTGIHGTNKSSEKTELSKASVVMHMSGNTETLTSQPSASASISSGKDEADFYENSPEPDLVDISNRPSTHLCIHREEAEPVLEDEELKEQVHHSILKTDQNKMSYSSRRHSCQVLYGASAASRTVESAFIVSSSERNSSQLLCNNKRSKSTERCPFHIENTGHTKQKHFLDENKEHTMQNQKCLHENMKHVTQKQQHFHYGNTELSLGVPCTEDGDDSENFVQGEKDSLQRNPEKLQIVGAPHNQLHHAANPIEISGSGTSRFYLSEQNDFSQDRSPAIIKQSAQPTFIVTKNSPIGAARLEKKNPHEGLTATPDKRSGTGKIRRHGGKRLRMGKTTVMLALVTLSTVVCFVPFLTVIVMRTSGTSFQNQTSSTGDLVYMFCIRSFLLNSIINPFVYFYVNPRFRQKVYGLLCRVGRWLLQLKLSTAQSVTSKSDT